MLFLSIVSVQVQQSSAVSASVPPLVPRVSSLDCPTLPQLMYLPTGPRDGIRIIQRIGTKYRSLGILLLSDNDGSITDGIIGANHYQSDDITYAIVSRWRRGQGRQPVTWATLMTVLHEIELSELAKDIASTINI